MVNISFISLSGQVISSSGRHVSYSTYCFCYSFQIVVNLFSLCYGIILD